MPLLASPLGCLPETYYRLPCPGHNERGGTATWGFESGNSLPSLGHLPRFQLKVLKWTENPFTWRNFGPAPEIGTLREATPKSEGETFLTL